MAKSMRFDHHLESLLEKAAKYLGVSQSEFVRQAIAEKCRAVLNPPLLLTLAPFIGRIKSKGGRARSSSVAFKRALLGKNTK